MEKEYIVIVTVTYFRTQSFDSDFATFSFLKHPFEVHLLLLSHKESCFGIEWSGLGLNALPLRFTEVDGRSAEALHLCVPHGGDLLQNVNQDK